MNEGDPFLRSGYAAHVQANDELFRQKYAEQYVGEDHEPGWPEVLLQIPAMGVVVAAGLYVLTHLPEAEQMVSTMAHDFVDRLHP